MHCAACQHFYAVGAVKRHVCLILANCEMLTAATAVYMQTIHILHTLSPSYVRVCIVYFLLPLQQLNLCFICVCSTSSSKLLAEFNDRNCVTPSSNKIRTFALSQYILQKKRSGGCFSIECFLSTTAVFESNFSPSLYRAEYTRNRGVPI